MTPVFIVAQYKCGTSWLLSALSAHPDMLGIREIDIVRAAHAHSSQAEAIRELQDSLDDERLSSASKLRSLAQRLVPTALKPLFEPPYPSGLPVDDTAVFDASNLMVNASNPERLTAFFGKSAWSSSADILEHLAAGNHPTARPAAERNFSRPQSIRDLSPSQAVGLYNRIRKALHPHQATNAFIETVAVAESEASHLVLKAADQVSVLDALQAWKPNAKKIAITRDGRDAAISALHYKKLMKERNAAWLQGSEKTYWDLLKDWSVQTQRIIDAARAGEIFLIRYEDLSRDFNGTFSRVLDFIGVDSHPETVRAINEATSFQSRTGRERGSDGKGVIRKGMVNEWKEYLSADDCAEAWSTHQAVLSILGYTESGDLEPLSLISTVR